MTLDQLDYILASDLSRFALEEESSPSTFYILTLGLGSKSLTDFTNCMDDMIRHKTALICLKILHTGERLSTKKLLRRWKSWRRKGLEQQMLTISQKSLDFINGGISAKTGLLEWMQK